ncbi:DDE-type integrase/transposase/recombinase [Streptomyces sp. NPDC005151]
MRRHHLHPDRGGWLYLATVIDISSRRVVDWATADHLRIELVADALRAACRSRRPAGAVVFHSLNPVSTPAVNSPTPPASSAAGCRLRLPQLRRPGAPLRGHQEGNGGQVSL